MNTPRNEIESLLAIDVGSVNTRAVLFDVAAERYHFVAAGQAPSTIDAPYKNAGEGARCALEDLQRITGRSLVGKDERLILPGHPDGSGVDAMVLSMSAGPMLNVVAVGLLEEVSLESAQRLAASTYANLAESIWLNDHRKAETQIDAIIQARPDIVLVAGGTDHGASKSIANLMEVVGLACYLMPSENRPVVLYAGNQDLAGKIKEQLEGTAAVRIAPNIRPGFDLEDLSPAQLCLAEVVTQIYSARLAGFGDLASQAGGFTLPTANAFGRVVRFLSRIYDQNKGVLGVDLGATATTVAAAFGGKLSLRVHRPLGVGAGIEGLLDPAQVAEIARWLPIALSDDDLLDYMHQKLAYPSSLPVTPEEHAIEQTIARQALRMAIQGISGSLGEPVLPDGAGLTAPFEPILAAGAVLTQAPTQGQSMLMLLDALQPVGVTTLVLDQNHLTPALGLAAGVSPILPVQILELGAFLNLGTVISPICRADPGTPILRARLVFSEGNETSTEVKQGSLHVLPLARNQTGLLYLEPLNHTDLGFGRASRGVKITGGALGAVIDGRGRPIRLPADASERQEQLKKWLWALGG